MSEAFKGSNWTGETLAMWHEIVDMVIAMGREIEMYTKNPKVRRKPAMLSHEEITKLHQVVKRDYMARRK